MNYSQELYPFQSRWISLNSQRIHYVDEGSGDVILFSHAPLGSSFMYRRFIHVLSKHFRCIALDFPGFGLSDDNASHQYSIKTQANIIDLFIERLNLKDIFAFGHDTGGPSIFKVAAEKPNLFKGLILTDTIIFPTIQYPRIHNMLKVVGSRLFQSINAYTNLLVRLTFTKGVPTRKLQKEEKQQYHRLFNTGAKRRRITQVLTSLRKQEAFMTALHGGFENQLRMKNTLLIYGEDDPVTKLGIPQRIHNMLPFSEMHFIHKEGHFPHEGQPDRMCAIIKRWIDNVKVLPENSPVISLHEIL